jgi:hypothetical protein
VGDCRHKFVFKDTMAATCYKCLRSRADIQHEALVKTVAKLSEQVASLKADRDALKRKLDRKTACHDATSRDAVALCGKLREANATISRLSARVASFKEELCSAMGWRYWIWLPYRDTTCVYDQLRHRIFGFYFPDGFKWNTPSASRAAWAATFGKEAVPLIGGKR